MQKIKTPPQIRRLFIGDVHWKVEQYHRILEKHTDIPSIQVWDFWFRKHHEWHLKHIDSKQHKIVFWNHDDYSYCYKPHSLWDASYLDGIMTIRWADSIDKHYRTEWIDWWREEELPYEFLNNLIDEVKILKPKIIVSHDCPQFIRAMEFGIDESSRTSQALQAIFEAWQPEVWIFGHHHMRIDKEMHGTRFICLEELWYIVI